MPMISHFPLISYLIGSSIHPPLSLLSIKHHAHDGNIKLNKTHCMFSKHALSSEEATMCTGSRHSIMKEVL